MHTEMDRPSSFASSSFASNRGSIYAEVDKPGSSSAGGSTGLSPRRPVLPYPSLHLGSFSSLDTALYSPSSPTREYSQPNKRSSTSPSFDQSQHSFEPLDSSRPDPGLDNVSVNSASSPSTSPQSIKRSSPSRGASSSPLRTTDTFSSTSSSSTTVSPTGRKQPYHLALPRSPPPSMSLPPLPSISPVSPFDASTFGDIAQSKNGHAGRSSLPPSPNYKSTSGSPSLPVPPFVPTRQSSSASSTTTGAIMDRADVPQRTSSSSPMGQTRPLSRNLSTSPSEGIPTIRDPSSMARRRTIVEINPLGLRIASGRALEVTDIEETDSDDFQRPILSAPILPSDLKSSTTGVEAGDEQIKRRESLQRNSIELGSLTMPIPRISPALDQAPVCDEPQPIEADDSAVPSSPNRLEKKRGSSDLRAISPASPNAKRSLPRPPSQRNSLPPLSLTLPTPTVGNVADPQHSAGRESPGALPRPPALPMDASGPSQPKSPVLQRVPTPSSQLPTRVASRYDAGPKSPDLPHVISTQPGSRHVSSKSASSIPVIGGLADAGPYPTASPAIPRPTTSGVAPAAGISGIGLGRPGQTSDRRRPAQEEICIECMMRDRDLADVTVSGEGVWDRRSDVAWEDLKAREEEILRSVRSESASSEMPSLDHSDDSEEDDSTSLPSTAHSSGVDDLEARRRAAVRMGRREKRRARRMQIDWKITHEVGWRGFRWEEGPGGEGLPRGFRGGRGGPLSEDAIKAVMRKFPSASAHRAKWMETYLYHQAILIREIRAEAQRTGRYPEPGDFSVPPTPITTDRQSVAIGPRMSSTLWAQQPTRGSIDKGRASYDKPLTALSMPTSPAISGLTSSPSTPADLAAVSHSQKPIQGPLISFRDKEQSPPSQRSPRSFANLREAKRKSVASNKTIEKSIRSEVWADTDDEAWPPISPVEGGLRPFSFAVRAGATAGRDSSDGHGQSRKSLFGRWGGSVTSFFGGSQGGSGSMVDMHLGLEQERLNRTSSNHLDNHPRAVSLASPTRPSFFGKDSRPSSVLHEHRERERGRKLNKSISTSRLSQMYTEESDCIHETKKKGLKGLFSKMKAKTHKKQSSRSSRPEPGVRTEQSGETIVPLAPPPNMAYLSNNQRDRSGSTLSSMTDGSPSSMQRVTGYPYGAQATLAPQAASSSGGSQSASPTSSKYNRRESYASGRDAMDERETRLSGLDSTTAGLRGMTLEADSYAMNRTAQMPHSGYSQPGRPHSKTASSYSSLLMPSLETPQSGVNGGHAYFSPPLPSPHGTFGLKSPNSSQQKNLPPLPPAQDGFISSSPDSFNAIFPEGQQNEWPRRSGYTERFQSNTSNSRRGYVPRASYDPLGDRPGRVMNEMNPRLAQSMYLQPEGMASAGSLGSRDEWPPKRGDVDARKVKARKGLRSIFGGAKAGRVA